MRIVIVGDLQFSSDTRSITERAMDDVRACKPDMVIPMGDYGSPTRIGYPEGLYEAKSWLEQAQCRIRPILGNHDLQHEIGRGRLPHGTMEAAARDCFGLEDTFGVEEYDDFRIIFVSLDSWTHEPPYSANECYVSDAHFSWIEQTIAQRPGKPVIMLTHAPSIGSGLMTVPQVHVRATNAFMDQNIHPHRWRSLAQHPEIVLWLSAHYHLGHDHPHSLRTDGNIAYALVGVHNECNRDGQRHSRVLDIKNGTLAVHTLDHETRTLRETPDWVSAGGMGACVGRRSAAQGAGTFLLAPFWDEAMSQTIADGRKYVLTHDNYLWEIDPETGAAMGTLHYAPDRLEGFTVFGKIMYRWTKDTLFAADVQSPWRFSRESFAADDHRQEAKTTLCSRVLRADTSGSCLRLYTEAGIWRVSGDAQKIRLQPEV